MRAGKMVGPDSAVAVTPLADYREGHVVFAKFKKMKKPWWPATVVSVPARQPA